MYVGGEADISVFILWKIFEVEKFGELQKYSISGGHFELF